MYSVSTSKCIELDCDLAFRGHSRKIFYCQNVKLFLKEHSFFSVCKIRVSSLPYLSLGDPNSNDDE